MQIGIGVGIGICSKIKQVYVSDSFNRADNATTMGVADTGQAWSNNAGNIGIISNKAYMPNAGTSIASVDSQKSNVAVSFIDNGIQEASLFNGVVVRYSDTSNYIRAVLQTNTMYIQRRQAGTTTIIASTSVGRVDGDIYRVVADANGITVYRNGQNVLSVAETFNNTATKQGIIMSSTLSRMDNFVVEEPQ